MNKQDLKDIFISIGYTFRGRYPNEFLYSPEGEHTGWRLRNDALEFVDNRIETAIYFERIVAYKYAEGGLGIWDHSGGDNPSVFINFYVPFEGGGKNKNT